MLYMWRFKEISKQINTKSSTNGKGCRENYGDERH